MSELPEKARRAGVLTRKAFKSVVQAASASLHEAAARKDRVGGAVSTAVEAATRATAQALSGAASGLDAAARTLAEGSPPPAADTAPDAAPPREGGRHLGVRVLQHGSAVLSKAAAGLSTARAAAPPFGAAAAGAFASAAGALGATLDAVALDEADFAALMHTIANHAARYAQLKTAKVSVLEPTDAHRALRAQLPARFADWLNRGHLPPAFRAHWADGSFGVVDAQGTPHEALQRKAAESLAQLQAALAAYPDIVPVDIEDVAAELLMCAIVEQGRDDRPDLRAVERVLAARGLQGLQDTQPEGGWLTSSAGLAFLALVTFSDRSRSLIERSEDFGARSAEILLASGASRLALAAGHVWWIGTLAGAGTSLVWERGRAKRARFDALQALAEAMERVLRRLEA